MDETIWKWHEEEINYINIYNNILVDPKLILSEELFTNDFIDRAHQNFITRINKVSALQEMTLTLMINETNSIEKIINLLKMENKPEYTIRALIMSPPTYKIVVEGPDNDVVSNILNDIKANILLKLKEYDHKIKFDNIKTIRKANNEFKFLADFDLQKLEFHSNDVCVMVN